MNPDRIYYAIPQEILERYRQLRAPTGNGELLLKTHVLDQPEMSGVWTILMDVGVRVHKTVAIQEYGHHAHAVVGVSIEQGVLPDRGTNEAGALTEPAPGFEEPVAFAPRSGDSTGAAAR